VNTPAHLLVGLAVCARRDRPKSGRSSALGAILPDLSLYLMAGAALFILQIPPAHVFGHLYFSPEWQAVFAVDNSFVIWAAVFAAALAMRRPLWIAFAGAGLLHLATDFPLHHDDARRHFWPISDWVFESPFSYWDSHHHAGYIAPLTLLAVLISAAIIWRRWPDWRMRALTLALCAAEVWVVRQWLLFF